MNKKPPTPTTKPAAAKPVPAKPAAEPAAEPLPADDEPTVASAPSPEPAPPAGPYTAQQWHGLDNYQCNHCLFDSFELPVMIRHLRENHRINAS